MANGSQTDEIACPSCGDDEHLVGERLTRTTSTDDTDGSEEAGRSNDLIRITCTACSTEWTRDPARRCPACDSADLYPVPVAIIEKSRGTQLSILGTRPEYLCWICDRDLIDGQRRSGTALMPDQMPTSAPDRLATPTTRDRGPSVGRSIDVSSGWDALTDDDLS